MSDDDKTESLRDRFRVRYDNSACIVRLTGDISNDVIFGLCDEIDLAIDYYNYSAIQIEIDSDGGSVLALEYYLTKLDDWKSKKISIKTSAMTKATSAAAYILALGEPRHRFVYPSAIVGFHYGSTFAQGHLRRSELDDHSQRLAIIDSLFLQRTVNSIIDAIHKLPKSPPMRRYPIEPHAGTKITESVRTEWIKIGLEPRVVNIDDHASIQNAVEENIKRIHEYGKEISPHVAQSLLLIDGVIGFGS